MDKLLEIIDFNTYIKKYNIDFYNNFEYFIVSINKQNYLFHIVNDGKIRLHPDTSNLFGCMFSKKEAFYSICGFKIKSIENSKQYGNVSIKEKMLLENNIYYQNRYKILGGDSPDDIAIKLKAKNNIHYTFNFKDLEVIYPNFEKLIKPKKVKIRVGVDYLIKRTRTKATVKDILKINNKNYYLILDLNKNEKLVNKNELIKCKKI